MKPNDEFLGYKVKETREDRMKRLEVRRNSKYQVGVDEPR
jgi:hypothetical protein